MVVMVMVIMVTEGVMMLVVTMVVMLAVTVDDDDGNGDNGDGGDDDTGGGDDGDDGGNVNEGVNDTRRRVSAARKLWRRQLDLKTLYVTNEPYHKIRLVALMYDSSLPQSP